jgi:cobalt/nickel transport protein
MTKFQKKILIWLIALMICSPIGIFLPKLFHANSAWGEWDVKSIREKTGTVPEGMAKDAAMWKAPIPDYKMKEDASLLHQSLYYIISGIVGIGFAVLITYGLTKLLARHEQVP